MLKINVILVLSAAVLMLIPIVTESAASTGGGTLSPAVDCSSLVLNMADCLSYVTNGSTEQMPEGSCCSGLKSVLKTDVQCVCEAFKNSAQLGVTLNITKALSLPTACHVSAPSVTTCGMNVGPGGTPAPSPAAVSPSSATAAAAPPPPATDVGGLGKEVSAPAPTPVLGNGTSSSPALAFVASSLIMIVFGMHLSSVRWV